MSQQASVSAVVSPLPAFEVRRLSFRYDSGWSRQSGDRSAWVINGMEFTVRQGEIVGVIGPNGSGKSSLLKLLTKLVRPQEGTIRLFGAELGALSRESISRQVAYMPQDLSYDFPFSVLDMVLMGRFPYRRDGLWNLVGWERREDLLLRLTVHDYRLTSSRQWHLCRVTPRLQWRHRDGFAPSSPSLTVR